MQIYNNMENEFRTKEGPELIFLCKKEHFFEKNLQKNAKFKFISELRRNFVS